MKYLILLLAVISLGAKEPDAVYLTWQNDPQTTMIIHWLTPLDIKQEEVQLKEARNDDWHVLEGSSTPMPFKGPYLIHSVEAIDLKPDTLYNFKIDKKEYSFRTAPSQLPISFIDGGDVYRSGMRIVRDMNREAARLNPLFAIVGGDLTYPNKHGKIPYKPWVDWIKVWSETMIASDGRMIPMIPVIGNHDVDVKELATPREASMFYHLFALPEDKGYRVLDFGQYLSLFLLDTNHTHPIEGLQTEWLRENLLKRFDVPNKFASYHVPAYPSHRSFNNKDVERVRKHFVPVFEEGKLKAAFEHHDHLYKRTYPLLHDMPHRDGILYMGDGAWGVDPRSPRKAWYLAEAIEDNHVILITVEKDRTIYRAVNADGDTIDQYVQPNQN
jgi:hypothetical protein